MGFRALIVTLVVGIVAGLVVSCTSDGDESVGRYFDQVNPSLNRAAEAFDAWTTTADEAADADLTTISAAEYRDLINRSLDAARAAQVAARDALNEVRVIIPPEACVEIHADLVEALRLSEQGFLEMVSYLQAGVRGVEPDEAQRIRANDLLADSDRAKEEALLIMDRSPDCS